MHARQNTDLDRDRPDITRATAVDALASFGVEQRATDRGLLGHIAELQFAVKERRIDFARELRDRVRHAIARSLFGSSAKNDVCREEEHGQRRRDAGRHDNRQLPLERE